MDEDNNEGNWPLSNYPIFIALIFLVATAVTLSMGDEKRAEDYAIYAYYFLVLGVGIRFLEFTLPENIISSVANRTGTIFEWFEKKKDSDLPTIIFLLIPVFIFFSFDKNYLLLLDLIYPVKNSLENYYFSYPSPLIDSTSWVIQRLYLFFAMFLSGYSMYILSYKISRSRLAGLYAGLLYMINPFIYVRIMAGHLYVLLSYAALPLLLIAFIDFLEKKGKREMITFLFLLTFVSLSLHVVVLALMILSIIFLFWFNKHRDSGIFKIILLSAILFTLLNSFWIIPYLTAKDTALDNINDEHLNVFAPKIDNFSDIFNIAGMYGFWRETYIYAKDLIPGWQLFSLFIILLSIYGFISFYKDQKIGIYAISLAVIGILGFVLASGINGPFAGMNHWLFENTILKGFRDSQKFVAMLAFSYAILGGLGLSRFEVLSVKKKYLRAIIGIALIIPFIYSFPFFNGFAGQIQATDYPADWYEVNDLLNNDSQDFKILFLPWHGYMDFSWIKNSDKRIANPSKSFFDKDVISPSTVELGMIYRQDSAPDQLYIDSLLKNRSNITNFGELVSILNVKYILLAKEVDYINYNFLFKQNDLELIKETETLYLLRNKNKVAKIYQTDDIENIGEKVQVGYKTISPVRIQIEGTNRKYLVFTEPYSKDWKLDGKEPVKAYGAVNAFENGGKEIRFERFYRVNLPAYVISLLAFVGMIAVYLGSGRGKKKIV